MIGIRFNNIFQTNRNLSLLLKCREQQHLYRENPLVCYILQTKVTLMEFGVNMPNGLYSIYVKKIVRLSVLMVVLS